MSEFPSEGVALTTLLVVGDLERSKDFYSRVLGAEIVRTYSGTSCVLIFARRVAPSGHGRSPTADKPSVRLAPPTDPDTVSFELTIRVPDCRQAHRVLSKRGAHFLTPLVESDWEIRAFFRDPDGHLLEISEAK